MGEVTLPMDLFPGAGQALYPETGLVDTSGIFVLAIISLAKPAAFVR